MRRSERSRGAKLSAEFELGSLRRVARGRSYREPVECGGLLMSFIAFIVLLLMNTVIPVTPILHEIFGLILVFLMLLGSALPDISVRPSPVTRRLFWYPGGFVEVVGGEAEPRVVRWRNVATVTVSYQEPEDDAPRLAACAFHTEADAVPTDLAPYRASVRRELAADATRTLAPRFVRPLIAAYDSDEPVTVGDTRVDHEGLTAGGDRVPWSEIRSIIVIHVPRGDFTAPVYAIEIHPADGRRRAAAATRLTDVPNGVFLPYLVAHAARRNGVTVGGFFDGV